MIINREKMPYANRRLVDLISEKTNGNIQQFANAIGMSQARINRLLFKDKRNDKWPKVTDDVLRAIIITFNLDDDYFILPPGEKAYPLDDLHDDFTRLREVGMIPHIPMTMAASQGRGFADCVMKKQCQYKPNITIFPPYDLTIDVKGDGMLPKFEPGDILAIKQLHDEIHPGDVYVLDTVDGVVLRRIYKRNGNFLCKAYNAEFEEFTVKKSKVYGIYKIIGLVRI